MTESGEKERVSIVFRALNEEKWFGEALEACLKQRTPNVEVEIVLVDSGSTDRTLEIAQAYGCRIVHIRKSDFTFGRSLNYGCDAATGQYLALISAHCIPAHETWLENLIAPLRAGAVDYSYGKQIGHTVSRFSEHQIFAKYFPDHDKLPQDGFFVNNANAALTKNTWRKYQFDEAVTGLEDMVLGKAIVADGGKVGYVADAPVFHIHEETFQQTRRRYYREALVLREIMPEIHFTFGDFLRFTTAAVFNDFSEALNERVFFRKAPEIMTFRAMQFYGAWRGHNEHRVLSRAQKESYYYPRPQKKRRASSPPNTVENTSRRASAKQ